MTKRWICIMSAVCLLVTLVCASCGKGKKLYSVESFDSFDTVTTVMGYAESQEEFDRVAGEMLGMLADYHRLFDVYHSYDGMENLYTVNRDGATRPVQVDESIMELLLYGKKSYEATDGALNIAMGSVLSLWHDCRTAAEEEPALARIPDAQSLAEAKKHTDIRDLLLNKEDGSVSFADPLLRLDVGAIAKGYAAEKIAIAMEERGIFGYVLNVGGNVRTIGEKATGEPWIVGVEDPREGEEYLDRLALSGESLVTSGSYQRYYTVDGVRYHHIIDPETMMPAKGFFSVSVISVSSAEADALSTALFCMSAEEGLALVESLPHAEAIWLFENGTVIRSSGFEKYSLS